MKIGTLLKQYRIANGKTQKDWVAGIVSPSYYSKVEKNKHRITAEDLLLILHANKIKLWDFCRKLDESNQEQYDEFKSIDRALNMAYYQQDTEKIRLLRQYVENSNLADKDNMLLYIDAALADTENTQDELSAEKRTKLKELLFSFTDFDETKLRIYINLMPFYDISSNLIIGKKIIAKLQNVQNSRQQAELLSVITNLPFDLIEAKRYDDTSFLIEAAAKVITRPELFFYKNTLVLLENMVNYHFDHRLTI